MSEGGSKGNKFLVVVAIVLVVAALGIFGAAFIDSAPTKEYSSPPPLTVETTTPVSSAPQPAPYREAPSRTAFVEEFQPSRLVLDGPEGLVVDTPLAEPTAQTTGVLSPSHPQLPSMLIDPGRVTMPGTNQGTVLAIAHSRKNDAGNVFNNLMTLPSPIPNGQYTTTLSDDAGHSTSYVMEEVLDIKKSEFGSEPYLYLQDNRPGRLLLVTSWVRGTYPPPAMARIIVGCDAAHQGCSAP